MLVTDKFVMLNFPKTGSSFARKVIKKVYADSQSRLSNLNVICEELILPNIRNRVAKNKSDHHGTYSQIPLKYMNREVVSIIRNPLDRFLSLYRYGAWKQSPPIPNTEIRSLFPSFPELDMDEFIEMQNIGIKYRLGFDIQKIGIGIQSIQLVQMFFRHPKLTLEKISGGSHAIDILSEMGDIRFLNQENLREDLIDFLSKHGFEANELAFIRTEKASNVSDYGTNDKAMLVTDRLKLYLENTEWLYDSLFQRNKMGKS